MTTAAIVLVVWLSPVLAWAMFCGRGGKRALLDRAAGSGWRPTDEAFVDPTSGEPVRVWTDPASGERAYLRDRL